MHACIVHVYTLSTYQSVLALQVPIFIINVLQALVMSTRMIKNLKFKGK